MSGVTQTVVGDVTVIGICFPYSRSRVDTRWNPKMWQDHKEYLTGLAELLKRASKSRLVVVGDFNQRSGQRSSTPLRLRAALQSALGPNLSIVTTGLGFQGRRTIDHIALSGDLASESLGVVSNVHEDGNLSDHFGVVRDLSVGDTRRKASSKNVWTALTLPPP